MQRKDAGHKILIDEQITALYSLVVNLMLFWLFIPMAESFQYCLAANFK